MALMMFIGGGRDADDGGMRQSGRVDHATAGGGSAVVFSDGLGLDAGAVAGAVFAVAPGPCAQEVRGRRIATNRGGSAMPTYIVLGNFTDQGIRTIKDTPKRMEGVKAIGKQHGVTVTQMYWTLGQYDVVAVLEAPDDTAITAFGLSVGMVGNVRTQTLRAYSSDDMKGILGALK
jgi:uncharacterized protein with GYD domain